jgi:hypothetical protein
LDKVEEKMKTNLVPLCVVCGPKVGKVGSLVTKNRRRECEYVMILVYTRRGTARYGKRSVKPIERPLYPLDGRHFRKELWDLYTV